MSGGLHCVHSSLAVLPETSLSMTGMYGYKEDPMEHANQFYAELKQAIEIYKNPNTRRTVTQRNAAVKGMADDVYSWKRRVYEWNMLFKQVLT
jgi:hypothetical protein